VINVITMLQFDHNDVKSKTLQQIILSFTGKMCADPIPPRGTKIVPELHQGVIFVQALIAWFGPIPPRRGYFHVQTQFFLPFCWINSDFSLSSGIIPKSWRIRHV